MKHRLARLRTSLHALLALLFHVRSPHRQRLVVGLLALAMGLLAGCTASVTPGEAADGGDGAAADGGNAAPDGPSAPGDSSPDSGVAPGRDGGLPEDAGQDSTFVTTAADSGLSPVDDATADGGDATPTDGGDATLTDGGSDGSDGSVEDAAPSDGSTDADVETDSAVFIDAQDGSIEAGPDAPQISAVHISQIGQNIHIEVDGTGFGPAPTVLPAVGELSIFGMTDVTQGGWCAGQNGCPVQLQYTSWNDSAIVIDGFGPQYGGADHVLPGDKVILVVRSSQPASGGASATWTGVIENEAPPPPDPDGPTPRVASVAFSDIGQNMHIEVDGSGFGNAPTTLPAVGELSVFGITDVTAGGWCAGRNGCPVLLQFTSWTDSTIMIDGFGPQYGGADKVAAGDSVSIYVQNAQGVEFMVWTGAVQAGTPPPPDRGGPTPRVASVAFSNVGQNMHIEVDGSGFGNAPTTLPAVGELSVFGITDVTAGGWCAGRNGCPVLLQFTSWSDGSIVIDGFGPQYGGADKVMVGDSVSIYVQNAQGVEFMVWTGPVQAGMPPPPDPGGPTPRVTAVTFSNIGQDLHIEVDGSGFGRSPTTLPVVGELSVFGITDVTAGGWCAGRNGCPVLLQFASWTDSTIVIDGFGTQYGGVDSVTAGDSVAIYVQNSSGPEFMIWTGTLP